MVVGSISILFIINKASYGIPLLNRYYHEILMIDWKRSILSCYLYPAYFAICGIKYAAKKLNIIKKHMDARSLMWM